MEIGRIAGGAVPEEIRADRSVCPAQKEPAPEAPLQEEKQCTLQISDEGYRRWELAQQEGGIGETGAQQAAGTDGEHGHAKAGGTGENGLPADSVSGTGSAVEIGGETEPNADRAARILQFVEARRDVLGHLKPISNKETDKEKVEALEELRQLEEEQEAEYRRMEAEAQALAKMRTKTKTTVEKGMRDLTIILESVEPQEEQEKQEKEKTAPSDEKEAAQREQTIGPQGVLIRNDEEDTPQTRAAMQQLGRQARGHALRAETGMDATIELIYENARANFDVARAEDELLLSRLESLCHVLEEDEVSGEDKDAAVDRFLKEGHEALGNIRLNMGLGLERLKNLRTLRVGRPASQNVVYASRAQETIGELADQSVLDGLYQDSFHTLEDRNLEELKERIRALKEKEQTRRQEEAARKEKQDEALAQEETDEADKVKKEREEIEFL